MKDVLAKLVMEAIEKLISGLDVQQMADEWVVARLRELAAKTETGIDDQVVALVAKALGVKA